MIRARIDYGICLSLDVDNYIERACISEGFYEAEVLEAICGSLRTNDVFWDVGANIGLMSIAAKKKRSDVAVVAFECSPLILHRLTRHIALNHVQVDVKAMALSSANGVAQFYIKTVGNHGVSSLDPLSVEKYESSISVSTVSASWLIEHTEIKRPNVLKLDVEGHEASVLQGFGPHLASPDLHTIVFEAADDVALARTSSILDPFGFAVAPLHSSSSGSPANFIALRVSALS